MSKKVSELGVTTGLPSDAVLLARAGTSYQGKLGDAALWPLNAQSGASYTLALTDQHMMIDMTNAANTTTTVPPNASVAFPIGTHIKVRANNAGNFYALVAAGVGVTLNSKGGNLQTLAKRYATLDLIKTGTDTWYVGAEGPAVADDVTWTGTHSFVASGAQITIDDSGGGSSQLKFKSSGTIYGIAGANASYAFLIRSAAGTFLAGLGISDLAWKPATASAQDIGAAAQQWRVGYFDRLIVLGSTLPTNGMYLPSANNVGIAANSLLVANFHATASAVNYFDFTASAATGLLQLNALGTDTNIGFGYISKGTGTHNFYTGGSTSERQFQVLANASAVNYQRITGGTTGNPTVWSNAGSDTDIGHDFKIAGAGAYRFFTAGGTDRQFHIAATASSVNYYQVTGAATGSGPSLQAAGTDTNITAFLASKGVGEIRLNGNGGFLIRATPVSVPANYFNFTGAAAGGTPLLEMAGSDTDIDFSLKAKGAGAILLTSGNGQMLRLLSAASAVNYMQIQANALGNPPTIAALGNDTNIHFVTVSKGTGVLTNLGSFTNGSATTANVSIDASGHIFKNTSQAKYKNEIEAIDPLLAIDIVNRLNPIFYRSLLPYDQQNWRKDWSYYGLIAEDVAKIDPRLAHWDREFTDKFDKNDQPIMGEEIVPTGVCYDKIGLFAVVAFREKIKNLETENAALLERVSRLESSIN